MLTSLFQAPYSVWLRPHIWKHPEVLTSALLPTSCGSVYFKIRREYLKWGEYLKWRRILRDGKCFLAQPLIYVIWGRLLRNFSCISQTSLKESYRRNGWWDLTKKKRNILQILDVPFDENPVRSFFSCDKFVSCSKPGEVSSQWVFSLRFWSV